ncbi:hypothetical protein ACWIGI_28615 [Nocardia sp. NPDC055321]
MPFNACLRIIGTERGRSAARFVAEDTATGVQYPMFMTEMLAIVATRDHRLWGHRRHLDRLQTRRELRHPTRSAGELMEPYSYFVERLEGLDALLVAAFQDKDDLAAWLKANPLPKYRVTKHRRSEGYLEVVDLEEIASGLAEELDRIRSVTAPEPPRRWWHRIPGLRWWWEEGDETP